MRKSKRGLVDAHTLFCSLPYGGRNILRVYAELLLIRGYSNNSVFTYNNNLCRVGVKCCGYLKNTIMNSLVAYRRNRTLYMYV